MSQIEDSRHWIYQKPIAHRGLHSDNIPENSLKAFEKCINSNYAIELDVRLTKDEIPIIYHYERLEEITQRVGRTNSFKYSELEDLNLENSSEKIPKLKDVLNLVDNSVPILIELKSDRNDGRLEYKVASLLDDYKGRFAIQSFNPRTLNWYRNHRPTWLRGQLSCFFDISTELNLSPVEKFMIKRLWTNYYAKPDFIAYHHRRLPYFPVTMKRYKGLPVLSWVIDNKESYNNSKLFSDNIIFEKFDP